MLFLQQLLWLRNCDRPSGTMFCVMPKLFVSVGWEGEGVKSVFWVLKLNNKQIEQPIEMKFVRKMQKTLEMVNFQILSQYVQFLRIAFSNDEHEQNLIRMGCKISYCIDLYVQEICAEVGMCPHKKQKGVLVIICSADARNWQILVKMNFFKSNISKCIIFMIGTHSLVFFSRKNFR